MSDGSRGRSIFRGWCDLGSKEIVISVVGSAVCDASTSALASEVGREIARTGAVLVCGGRSGVMEAACRGAKAEGGITVGILPGPDRGEANPFVDLAIATGLGEARNAIVVRTADAVVAVGGGFGTLSEIGLALKMGRPVIGLGTWELQRDGKSVDAVIRATSPAHAVALAATRAKGLQEGQDG